MTQNEELLYHFDPLCGWCFAFRPTMQAVVAAHPDLPVRLSYGGLVVGERVQPIAVMRDYLMHGLEQVRQVAGVAAGPAFYKELLAAGTYVSNSEPPCRAIWAVEQLAPARAYAFADSLPEVFYGAGRPLDAPQVLAALAVRQAIDPTAFLELWQSDAARTATQHAFAAAHAAGLTTYPTLFYQRNDERTQVTRGYLAPAAAVDRIASLRG